MEIVVTNESDVAVFAITGRLDAVSVPQLEERLNQLVDVCLVNENHYHLFLARCN